MRTDRDQKICQLLRRQYKGRHFSFSHTNQHSNLSVSCFFLVAVIGQVMCPFFTHTSAIISVAGRASLFKNSRSTFLVTLYNRNCGWNVRAAIGWNTDLYCFFLCVTDTARQTEDQEYRKTGINVAVHGFVQEPLWLRHIDDCGLSVTAFGDCNSEPLFTA